MTIALRAAGAPTAAGAAVGAVSPVVHASAAAGDLSILTVTAKPFGTQIKTPSGWTKLGEATNGTTAATTDAGSTKILTYYRISATPGAIGNLTQTGGNSISAVINTYSTTAGWWALPAYTTGADATNNANFAATGDAGIDVAAGDLVHMGIAVCGDNGTVTAISIGGLSGATVAATNTRTNHAVTAGLDSRLITADAAITAGSSSAAPQGTYTNAGNTSGTAAWVRLREIATPTAKTPPTLVQTVNMPGTTTTSPKTSAAFDVVAGDLLVVTTNASGAGVGYTATPTASGGSVTWTLRQDHTNVSGYGDSRVWTGAVGATATGITVSVATDGWAYYGFACYQWRDHGGVGSTAKLLGPSAGSAMSAPEMNFTTTDQNSALVFATNDGNAQSGATVWRAFNTGGDMTEVLATQVVGFYGGYHGYVPNAGYLTEHTLGLMTPAFQIPASITVEVLGAAGGSPQTVNPSSITTGESLGSPTLSAVVVAAPSGIGTLVGVGSPVLSTTAAAGPSGISTGAAFGSPTITQTSPQTVNPSGIASGAAVGSAALSAVVTASPTGVGTGAAVGTPTAATTTAAGPAGIVSGQAVGTPALATSVTVSPAGIGTGAVVGTPTLAAVAAVVPSGITSGQGFGTPGLNTAVTVGPAGIGTGAVVGTPGLNTAATVSPAGIGGAEALGSPVLTGGPVTVNPAGIGSAAALGEPVISNGPAPQTVSPAGIGSGFTAGSPTVSAVAAVAPAGIPTGAGMGSPALSTSTVAGPSGIETAETLGTPTLELHGAGQTVNPDGILSGVVVPGPVLTVITGVGPAGIGTGAAVGAPSLTLTTAVGPAGIGSGETFGAPSIYTNQALTITVEIPGRQWSATGARRGYIGDTAGGRWTGTPGGGRYSGDGSKQYTTD